MGLQEIILSSFGIILAGLATWGVERLTAFLNSKIKNTKALQYSIDALNIVSNAVKSTYQTYVQALKDKDIFTAEAQKLALNMAVNQAQAQLSSELKKYIKNNFGDINAWITSQVEASLYDLKK